MKIKTQNLIGPVLNLAVALCEGKGIEFECPSDPWLTVDGIADQPLHSYTPSTDWSQGGPIIERENIDIEWVTAERCRASYDWLDEEFFEAFGLTPLIAAMRCYVASKLGNEVEVPDELMET